MGRGLGHTVAAHEEGGRENKGIQVTLIGAGAPVNRPTRADKNYRLTTKASQSLTLSVRSSAGAR